MALLICQRDQVGRMIHSWGAILRAVFGLSFMTVQGYQPPQRASRTLPMMSKSKMKYVSYVPTIVPAGRVIVHNSARHNSNTVPGTGGFRAWFATPHHDYVICS